MLLSVVVPVYNVKEYLKSCVESIYAQDYGCNDFEVLLIDDGSNDGSAEMCDTLEENYDKIKAYHKDNGGLSDARNYGVLRCSGEYIVFLDSDDSFVPFSLKGIFDAAIQNDMPDILMFNALKITQNSKELLTHGPNFKNPKAGRDYLKEVLPNIFITAWSNAYKRDFLLKNKLFFKKGLLHEDEEFVPRAFLLADRVLNTCVTVYSYFVHKNTIMTKKDKIPHLKSILIIADSLNALFRDYGDDLLYKKIRIHLSKICYKLIYESKAYSNNRSIINFDLLKTISVSFLERIRYFCLKHCIFLFPLFCKKR